MANQPPPFPYEDYPLDGNVSLGPICLCNKEVRWSNITHLQLRHRRGREFFNSLPLAMKNAAGRSRGCRAKFRSRRRTRVLRMRLDRNKTIFFHKWQNFAGKIHLVEGQIMRLWGYVRNNRLEFVVHMSPTPYSSENETDNEEEDEESDEEDEESDEEEDENSEEDEESDEEEDEEDNNEEDEESDEEDESDEDDDDE
ncbi:uncharacterized protein M6B38_325315 [Iris pallida]|uniref:Uncharacterized protein n=1 Tax=Iris pallida TaxID=29817 RepID=A0AAX6H6X7_IRIPA|nr:uncharacterized protein M6B38_325315 [Iris pallida]